MATMLITYIIIGVLLFLTGLMLGLLYERRQLASLYNGNVLVTSQVEQLLKSCTSEDKKLENVKIKYGLKLLSEGFSVSEVITIIAKENESILSNS